MDPTIAAALIGLTGVIIATLISVAVVIYQTRKTSGELAGRQQAEIEKVAHVKPGDIQEVAASQLAIISSFNQSVLRQAQQSFILAFAAAIVGLMFFVAAVSFLLLRQPQNIASASIISGALVELISAINFYLYGRASSQFSTFHSRLDRIQQFLLANSVCESLAEDKKQEARAEIVRVIVNSAANTGKETEKEKSK